MTLGLATVSASADGSSYADKSDISYQEAADVLSKVGVFEGKGENFAPKDNLNRAEAAKLIAYLMLGNKTAESIKGNGNRFSDVPADHWAVGYIEYLASAGVVSGVGDGKFNPNGQVTAVQFAKMLCVALGYDAQVEGYVGESWNINIMKQANDDEIFKTLDVSSNDALTREQAAQMCLNALKADTVEYESKGDTLTINNSTVVLNAKKAKDKTTTATKGNAIKDDDANGTTNNPYTLQLGEDLYNGDLKMEKTHDDFGRPANKWTYKNEKIDTYMDNGDLRATYTDEIKRGPLYDLLGSSVYDHLVLGSGTANYATLNYYEDGDHTYVNNSTNASTNKTEVEKFVQKNGDKAINSGNSSGRGAVTQVFVDKDDNVTITVINTYLFKASSDYRASTEDIVIAQQSDMTPITLDSTRIELKDHPEIKDMKKDDYVLLTVHRSGNTGPYEVKTATKAELLTAKVDKYVDDDTVTLDGTTYKYSKKAHSDVKKTEYSIGQETTVVLDNYGYIIYVDEAVVASNYVFISELYQNGGSTSKVQANAYFTDGTNADITIKEISGVSLSKTNLVSKADGTTAHVKTAVTGVVADDQYYVGWYTYNKNTSGEYTLNKLSSSYKQEVDHMTTSATNTQLTNSDSVKFITGATTAVTNATYRYSDTATTATTGKVVAQTAKANDKTIFVVTYGDNNDVDVYTGVKNMPEIILATDGSKSEGVIFSVLDSGSYAKYVFVSLEGKYSVFGSESESLLYVVKLDHKNVISTDTTYYEYKALDENAKEIKIEADGNNIFSTDYMAYYKTSKNSSDRYTKGQPVPTGAGNKYFNNGLTMSTTNSNYAIDADKGTLTIAGDSFTLDDNYKLVVVSKADALNKLIKVDGYEANIVTADGLAAMVKGYDVTYRMQAKLKDTYVSNKGGKIVEAYVTIETAVANGGATGSSTTSSGILKLMLPSDILKGDAVTVFYGGSTAPTGAQVKTALEEALKGTGYSIKKMSYDADKAVTAYVFDLQDASGAEFAGALKYDPDHNYADTDGAANNAVQYVGLSGTATATDVTNLAGNKLFVASTDTLVIPSGINLSVTGAYIDGKVTIQKGGALTVSGGTPNMVITKSGHVTVNVDGTLNGSAAKVTIEKGSTSLESAGTTKVKELVADGNVTVTNGTFEIGSGNATVANGGKFTISGGAVSGTGTIEVKSGSSMTTSGNASVANATTVKSGASLTVGGNSVMTNTTTVESGSTVAVNETAQVQSIKSSSGSGTVEIKVDGKTRTIDETAKSVGDTKHILTVTPTNVDVTGTSLSTKTNNVYYVNEDTTSFTITVKNTTKYTESDKNPETTFDVEVTEVDTSKKDDVKNYTLNPSSVTLGKDGASTITVSSTAGVKGNLTIEIKPHSASSASSGS